MTFQLILLGMLLWYTVKLILYSAPWSNLVDQTGWLVPQKNTQRETDHKECHLISFYYYNLVFFKFLKYDRTKGLKCNLFKLPLFDWAIFVMVGLLRKNLHLTWNENVSLFLFRVNFETLNKKFRSSNLLGAVCIHNMLQLLKSNRNHQSSQHESVIKSVSGMSVESSLLLGCDHTLSHSLPSNIIL